MLTVACVWVRGPVPFTSDAVVRLRRMVRRYLSRPHQFVCLTDRPWLLPSDLRTIPIESLPHAVPPNGRGYWAKIELFNRRHGLTGRVLYLDLDSVVVDSLEPIVDAPAPFAITADALIAERAHLTRDRYGRLLVRRFNSSVMVWDAASAYDLYDDWSVRETARLSTDQDWIGERRPDALALPYAWFPRLSRLVASGQLLPLPADAKVVLAKKPKPHDALRRWPWFDAWWGGWREEAVA